MEELKLLVDMVAGLPHMALWVIAAFWAYKVVVVGSLYGVIRLAINKTHSWLVTPRIELRELRPVLDGITIRAELNSLVAQIHRLRGKGVSIESEYIHSQSVDWLRDAIDDKIAKDAAKK
jgi:hypothetical protein